MRGCPLRERRRPTSEGKDCASCRGVRWISCGLVISFILAVHPGLKAEEPQTQPTEESAPAGGEAVKPTTPAQPAKPVTLNCASDVGQRIHCEAETSAGVALVRSTGAAPCLLGKTWGYDDSGIWVSDGCSGQFVVGKTLQERL